MAERAGLEIYPVPRFRDPEDGRAAALNNDAASITIDESAPDGQYRFALAHECAHYVLHREYISEYALKGSPEQMIKTWRQMLSQGSPQSLADLERQADVFARCVLLPSAAFRAAMDEAEDQLPANLDWFSASNLVFQVMADSLAGKFRTTQSSVLRRLRDFGVTRD